MQRSNDRILTTHVGSLIRPPELQEFLRAKQSSAAFDRKAYDACLTESVAAIVRRQAEAGVDVVSDGEFGKAISWSQYALERLSGFERRPVKPGANPFTRGADRERFAEFYAELDAHDGVATTIEAVCGRSSAANASGSDFSGSMRPSAPMISYLYLLPGLASGMKISQKPLPRTRMGWRRPSHELKSPTTLTRWAFGANTANATPETSSRTMGCAPSFS